MNHDLESTENYLATQAYLQVYTCAMISTEETSKAGHDTSHEALHDASDQQHQQIIEQD